jgi:hypothetical protein
VKNLCVGGDIRILIIGRFFCGFIHYWCQLVIYGMIGSTTDEGAHL